MLGRGRPKFPGILTPAEERVLALVREGKTNGEIAEALALSPNTVKYHVANMLAKLDLPDRVALAQWRGQRGPGRRRALIAAGAGLGAMAAVGAIAAVLLVSFARDDAEEAAASAPIAFAAYGDAAPGDAIYLLDPVTRAVQELGLAKDGFVQRLVWAPDGGALAYFAQPPTTCPAPVSGNCGGRWWLRPGRAPAVGDERSEPRGPFAFPYNSFLQWNDSDFEVQKPSVEGATCQQVAAGGRTLACVLPAVSPAGDFWELHLIGIGTGSDPSDRSVVVPLQSSPRSIAISRDGAWLALSDDVGQLRMVEISNLMREPGPIDLVISGLASGLAPAWSPDGSRLAFVGVDTSHCPDYADCPAGLGRLWTYHVESSDLHQLAGAVRAFAWSPDGRRIAFISDHEDERGEIYVIDIDGANLQRLTFNDLWETTLAWAPEQ